jgi:hypothetical protein
VMLVTAPIASWFDFLITGYRAKGPQPLASLIFLGGLLVNEWRWRAAAHQEIHATESSAVSKAA